MALSAYYYDPFHEPFFNVAAFSRLLDAAWDARAPARDVQRRADAPQPLAATRPRMDLHEAKDKNATTAAFALPGLQKEDVRIGVHSGRLGVAGQSRAGAAELDGAGYAVRARRFARTVPLPVGTKPEDVRAKMEHGVLCVGFPRAQPEMEAEKITIA